MSTIEKTCDLLTAEEVAAILRVDARTVNERYAYREGFPKHIKPGKQKLWKKVEIQQYIDGLFKKAA
jgi:predicted DNA-binding transcriptional regulator AlpA